MIITCEECRTSFNLDEKLLKPTGSKVRCSKCGDVFITFPPPPEAVAPPEAEPVAPAVPAPPVAERPEATALEDFETPAAEEADDMDLGLDLEPDEEDLATAASEESELPVDELDLSDLGLDEDTEDEPSAEVSEVETAAADAELDAELDFSDLDLGDDEAEIPEAVSEEPSGGPEEEGELDLSDLDLDLDQEEGAAPSEAEIAVEDDLDLSDLDLGADIEEAVVASGGEAPAGDELDLSDLDLDPDIEEAAAEAEPAAPAADDELDLSDLDLGPDVEEAAAEAAPAAPGAEDELNLNDLDLDLDLEDEDAMPDDEVVAAGELDLDELDLEAMEDEGISTGDMDELDLGAELEEAPADAGEGLDLDDLELDEVEDESAAEDVLGDLDLDLGAEDDSPAAAVVTPQQEISAGQLDISELEAVFDAPDDEVDTSDESVEEYDLEFDMETLEGDEAAEPEAVALSDSADELDLEEVETMLDSSEEEMAPAAEGPDLSDDGMDLELDLEEMEPEEADELSMTPDISALDGLPGADTTDYGAASAFAETMDMETLEKESMALEGALPDAGAAQAVAPVKQKRRRGIGKPVKILLYLFLLMAVAGGALYYSVMFMGIQIPYVSDFLNPQDESVNRIEIIQGTVRSKFVENNKAGKLFIITGRVTNGYKKPRNFLSVTGKLYGKGNKRVATQTVFAGNMLTAIEQATLDLPSINKRLRNRVGEKKQNMNVKPGAGLPFMVVFANLPAQLEEFTVELGTSISAQ